MPKMTLKNEGRKMILKKIIAPKLKLTPKPIAPNPQVTA